MRKTKKNNRGPARFGWLIGVLLLGLLLAGCEPDESPPPPTPTALIDTIPPTPTLVAELKATEVAAAALPPTETPTATATKTPPPTPTPTQPANVRIDAAATAVFQGELETAIVNLESISAEIQTQPDAINTQSESTDALTDGDYTQSLIDLGAIYVETGDFQSAIDTLLKIDIARRSESDAAYFLGKAFVGIGDCDNAELSFTNYLSNNADLGPYIHPQIADCRLAASGSVDGQILAYEAATATRAHFLINYFNRLELARLYSGQGRFSDAADLYDLMRDEARTYQTRAEMAYLAANNKILAGNTEAGYLGYEQLVNNFPDVYSSYEALIALVDAERPVSQFQRGVVDYHAGAYQPCVTALEIYLADNPSSYDREAHIFLAYCYEGLGNIEAAVAALDEYGALSVSTAGRGLSEKGDLYRRIGQRANAIQTYDELATTLPGNEFSPRAAYWSAVLTDWSDIEDEALERYRSVAENYPAYENAAYSLFRAGWLARKVGDDALATEIWEQAARGYPQIELGQAAIVWLLNSDIENSTALTLTETINRQTTYYNARLFDIVAEREPFAPPSTIDFENEAVLDQDSAETFLRTYFDIGDDADIRTLPPFITEDPHFVRGAKLWQLREFELAKREFEFVRQSYSNDGIISYQLALYFRDIGLYRSSIIAASTLLFLTETNPFSAPEFLASLAYPVYYRDLVVEFSAEYGYDPLVQFALVRQESLYESFATSSAVAQGLAQVIPDTGAYIASKLAWPNYQNSDLYKPSVGLRFGGFYLAEQLALFDGDVFAALAAYNGGPGNALNWYELAGSDIDQYVETVTFGETRLYIERIYFGHAIYKHLYTSE